MREIDVQSSVHFKSGWRSNKEIQEGKPPPVWPRSPRVAKLMALAIRFEGLIKGGVVADYAERGRPGPRFAGPDVPDRQFAQSGSGYYRSDFIPARCAAGQGSHCETGPAANCGGGGLEEAAADVALFGVIVE